jgi:hypothetical protein
VVIVADISSRTLKARGASLDAAAPRGGLPNDQRVQLKDVYQREIARLELASMLALPKPHASRNL